MNQRRRPRNGGRKGPHSLPEGNFSVIRSVTVSVGSARLPVV
ncbi:hypothetical protein [Saccharospirillum mangrovi]|nr:hypothetical protein [Saccharospirillum mangrovi]